MLVNRPSSTSPTPPRCTSARPRSRSTTPRTPEQIEYLFGNAGNRVVVTERAVPADRARRAASASPALEHVVVIDGEDEGTHLARRARGRWATPSFDFEAAWRAVEPDDVLTLIYTSGTTGPPKGVQLTHRNLMAEIARCRRPCCRPRPAGASSRSCRRAHIADRWAVALPVADGVRRSRVTCLSPTRATIVRTCPRCGPTAWGAVPRIWEKLKAALEAAGRRPTRRALPGGARRRRSAQKLGLDQAAWLVVGAAPTPVEVLEFFAALGLPICELWGMSETSSCATINPPGAHPGRHVRPAAAGRRAEARRRRRAARARRRS